MTTNYKVLGRQVPVQVVKDYFTERMAPAEPTEEQFKSWASYISREESMNIIAYNARRTAADMLNRLPDDALALTGDDLETIDRAVCMMAGA